MYHGVQGPPPSLGVRAVLEEWLWLHMIHLDFLIRPLLQMCQVMEGVKSSSLQPDFLQGSLLGGYGTHNLGRVVTRSRCSRLPWSVWHMGEPVGSMYMFSGDLDKKSVRYLISLPAPHKWGDRGWWGWGQVAGHLHSGCLSTDFSERGRLWLPDPSQSRAEAERWGGHVSDWVSIGLTFPGGTLGSVPQRF